MLSIPNLDAMTNEELMRFANETNKANGGRKLGIVGKGSVRITKDLVNYAWNRSTAMRCRIRGDIQTALHYEDICDRIYQDLPECVRW